MKPIYEENLDFAKYTIRQRDDDQRLQEFQETGENFRTAANHGNPEAYESIKASMMDMDEDELDALRDSMVGPNFHDHSTRNQASSDLNKTNKKKDDEDLDKDGKVKAILSAIKQNIDDPDFIGNLFELIKHGSSKPNFSRTVPSKKETDVLEQKPARPSSKTNTVEAPKKPNFRISSAHSSSKETSQRIDTPNINTREQSAYEKSATKLMPPKSKQSIEIPKLSKVEDEFLDSIEKGEMLLKQTKPQTIVPESKEMLDSLNLDFFQDESKPSKSTTVKNGPELPKKEEVRNQPVSELSKKSNEASKPAIQGPASTLKIADSLFESVMDGGNNLASIQSHNSITIRVRSSIGGDCKEIGLTLVKLFDIAGKEIQLLPKDVSVAGVSPSVVQKIVSADPFRAKTSDLFKMEFPLLSSFVDIKMKYFGTDPGFLRIWNYFPESSVGCKEIEVIVNNNHPIQAKLKPAVFSKAGDYYQDIRLSAEASMDEKSQQNPASEKKLEKNEITSSQNYELLFGDDGTHNASPSKTSLGAKSRRRGQEPNVQITVKKSTNNSQNLDSYQLNVKEQQVSIEPTPDKFDLNLPDEVPKEISRRAGASLKNTGGDYRSRRDEMKQKHKIAEPIIDNVSDFVKVHGQKGYQGNTTRPNDPLMQIGLPIGDSQVVKLDLEESQIIPKEENFHKNRAFLKKEDAMDALDMQLTNLRKFEKKNMSRIELSGLDLSQLPPKTTALGNQVIQKPTSWTNKAAETKPFDMKELFTYSSFSDLLEQNEMFFVPELPKGRILDFDLYSTWGDKFYIGLCGIEVFDEEGKPVAIDKRSVTADPPNLNILPETTGDPRTEDKLVDGVYNTTDDLHCWMAPFAKSKPNRVRIDLGKKTNISLVRIWNYNKDRVHTARGAREFSIKIDGMLMCFGVISRGTGETNDEGANAEWLVFCKDELFNKIEDHDWLSRYRRPEKPVSAIEGFPKRPTTSSGKDENFDNPRAKDISDIKKQLEIEKQKLIELEKETLERKKMKEAAQKLTSFVECTKLSINILENWGDPHFVGLTGIEFYDENKQAIRLTADCINAKPRDLKSELQNNDKRILENLINGDNQSCEPYDMWLTQFSKHTKAFLYVNFGEKRKISGMRVWNYNQSESDSYRGIKKLEILADLNKITSNFIYLKKAPGRDDIDFSQFIPFPPPKSKQTFKTDPEKMEKFIQLSFPPKHPTGFSLRFNFLSTWGDSYYIGLNKIEIYDRQGKPLLSSGQVSFRIAAIPPDINILPGTTSDGRSADNLAGGNFKSIGSGKGWLAPYINPHVSSKANLGFTRNELFLIFQEHVSISCINIWNYSKTPARGVKEFEVYMDECVIFAVDSRLLGRASTSYWR